MLVMQQSTIKVFDVKNMLCLLKKFKFFNSLLLKFIEAIITIINNHSPKITTTTINVVIRIK